MLLNDTPTGELTVEYWGNVTGNFSIEWDELGGFTVYDPAYRTAADMLAKQQEINDLIDAWKTKELIDASSGYAAADAALGHLNTFVNGFGGSGYLAEIAGSVGAVIGGFVGSTALELGGGFVGVLADAWDANPNASTQQIINIAEQSLIDK